MNVRLERFLAAENISQSQFADIIGVARASVSHILSGRNKPGYDFIASLMRCFPSLNIDWLIMGKGKMYKTPAKESLSSQEHDFNPDNSLAEDEMTDSSLFEGSIGDGDNKSEGPSEVPICNDIIQKTDKQIVKVMVLYSDGTFSELC